MVSPETPPNIEWRLVREKYEFSSYDALRNGLIQAINELGVSKVELQVVAPGPDKFPERYQVLANFQAEYTGGKCILERNGISSPLFPPDNFIAWWEAAFVNPRLPMHRYFFRISRAGKKLSQKEIAERTALTKPHEHRAPMLPPVENAHPDNTIRAESDTLLTDSSIALIPGDSILETYNTFTELRRNILRTFETERRATRNSEGHDLYVHLVRDGQFFGEPLRFTHPRAKANVVWINMPDDSRISLFAATSEKLLDKEADRRGIMGRYKFLVMREKMQG